MTAALGEKTPLRQAPRPPPTTSARQGKTVSDEHGTRGFNLKDQPRFGRELVVQLVPGSPRELPPLFLPSNQA